MFRWLKAIGMGEGGHAAAASDAVDDRDRAVLANVRSRYAVWRREVDAAVRERMHRLALRGLLIAHGAGAARRFTLSEAGRHALAARVLGPGAPRSADAYSAGT